MKNINAVKSIAAGLGLVLAAGPASAQVAAEAAATRVSLGATAAMSAPAALYAPAFASPTITALAPLTAPAASLSAAPLAAPALAVAPVAAPAAALVALPAASLPSQSRAPVPAAAPLNDGSTMVGRFLSRLGLSPRTTSANADHVDAAAEGARFDGSQTLAAAADGPATPGSESSPKPLGSALTRFSKGVTPELQTEVTEKAELVKRLRAEIGKVIVGQTEMIDSIVMAMIASEHVFLEGVPGVAKTQAVKAASDAVSGDFKRIQGTPDKLPSDIIGAEILQDDAEHPGMKIIKVQFGPVFTNILLVDEINRMMPKTQSALLEAMAEGQVTIGNTTYKLSRPFIVLATQNPIEQEGTYRLPEAQQDRFMLKVNVPLPSVAELVEIMERFSSKDNQPKADKVQSLAQLDEIRKLADRVHVDPAIKSYIAALVDATSHPEKYGVAIPKGAIENDGGAGPRAAIFLLKAARIHALMEGRAFVGPGDVAAVAKRVLRHRIILGFSAPRDLTTDKFVDALVAQVAVPTR
jgi:MoxR-like ATPase